LQLVNIITLSIAIKYENKEVVTIKSFQKLYGDSYEAENFLEVEIYMLNKLKYKLKWLSLLIFLRKINEKINKIEFKTRILIKYLLKAILPDKSFVAERLSIIVAVTYCLTRCILRISK
jgi:hypothetical protein